MNHSNKQQNDKSTNELPSDKKGRLIIRNLEFSLNEKHLRSLFTKFGKIIDIRVPLNQKNDSNKGFGFVQFENKNIALKAIKELNGSTFKGRKVFLDLSVSKDQYQQQKVNNKKKSDDQIQQQQQQDHQLNQDELDEPDEPDELHSQQDHIQQHHHVQQHDVKDKDKNQNKKKKEKNNEQKKEKNNEQKKEEDLSKTVFVKNISYEMSEEEFKDFYKQFGQVEYARIVKQKDSGLSNGTGFVKFKDSQIAQQLIEQQQTNNILFDLEFNGRQMNVYPAKSREQIEQQQQEQQQDEGPKQPNVNMKKIKKIEQLVELDRNSKRNIKLAMLGTLEIPNDQLSEQDQQKRQQHYIEKLEKLKNSNKFVSNTRILIKGIPKRNYDESDLKSMIQQFINSNYTKNEVKHKKFVKQIQLLREKSEVEQKSKGVAFVEFIDEQVALKFMGYLIQDQQYKKINEKMLPIIEFAIQDIRIINKKLKIFEKKQEHQRQVQERTSGQKKQKKDKSKVNQDQMNKQIVEQMITDKTVVENKKKVKDILKNMKSRGIRQRLKKRIEKQFGTIFQVDPVDQVVNPKKETPIQKKVKHQMQEFKNVAEFSKKQQKVNEKKQKKQKQNQDQNQQQQDSNQQQNKKQIDAKELEEIKEIQKIRKQIKNLKKDKRRLDNEDHLDDIEQRHQQKLQKKVKWSNNI